MKPSEMITPYHIKQQANGAIVLWSKKGGGVEIKSTIHVTDTKLYLYSNVGNSGQSFIINRYEVTLEDGIAIKDDVKRSAKLIHPKAYPLSPDSTTPD